jgi:hypothetical protein
MNERKIPMMIYTYSIYIIVSAVMTVWVGRTLNSNGRVFLVETFDGNEEIADSVNHLLLVGFYLINIGFVSLALKYGEKPTEIVGAIEFLSMKIGAVIVVLGVMHFFNMGSLMKFRRAKLFKSLAREKEADETDSRATETAVLNSLNHTV